VNQEKLVKKVGTGTLAVTGDEAADRLLNTDPLALLLGMLLDQQIPMEWAFMGPFRLSERLGVELDAHDISERDPDAFAEVVRVKPALHRFPGSMAERMQALCRHVADHYDGDAGAVWNTAADGEDLFGRLRDLPGYGDEKARILTAVLAKRFGVRPEGWEAQAGAFADSRPRSVADIDGPQARQRVRAWKKQQRALGKGKDE
jgi:uncharacterized HhH-GPD family protein